LPLWAFQPQPLAHISRLRAQGLALLPLLKLLLPAALVEPRQSERRSPLGLPELREAQLSLKP
jgi:hypothetical protein